MFTGYNLKIDEKDIENFNYYNNIGKEILNKNNKSVQKKIDDYCNNGIVDGTKVQKDWFPEVEADIFISYSHKDIDLALALAGWINDNFKSKEVVDFIVNKPINCFIDSSRWEYNIDLLKSMNDKYSDKVEKSNGEFIYDYNKAINVSSHVDIMLLVALQKMINKTETVFLINTDNSIAKFSEYYDNATFSPWIYSEIINTELIQKRKLIDYRKEYIYYKSINEQFDFSDKKDEMSIAYGVSLNHLKEIKFTTLDEWKNNYYKKSDKYKSKYPLDELYSITGAINNEQLKRIENYGF